MALTSQFAGVLRVHIVFDIYISNTILIGYKIKYGTGTAPSNAAADTGTQIGTIRNITQNTATNQDYPCGMVGESAALTAGTAYWVDIAVTGVNTDVITPEHISFILEEI